MSNFPPCGMAAMEVWYAVAGPGDEEIVNGNGHRDIATLWRLHFGIHDNGFRLRGDVKCVVWKR